MTPLEKRTYKIKNPTVSFYCALCRTPRALTTSFKLSLVNYFQVLLLTVATTAITYPIMSFRAVFSFFVFLAVFEWARRANYRKEIPCPHCGFDASWYKKDVKIARRLVADHWAKKNPTEKPPAAVEELVAAEQNSYEESPFDQRY